MACPPPRRPVMTVSATQEASDAATAASAALPPSCRISIPASTVCGCPAATPAGRAEGAIPVATLLRDRASAARVLPARRRGLRSRRPGGLVDPHEGSQAGHHLQARAQRDRYGLGAGADRAPDDAHQPAHRAPARAPEGSLLPARPLEARRPPAPVLELPAAERLGGLPRADQGAGPQALARFASSEGGCLSESRRRRGLLK